MAYETAEQGGDGIDVSLADFVDLPSGSPMHGQRALTPFVSAPAIGKIKKVTGSVTITRANVVVARGFDGAHVDQDQWRRSNPIAPVSLGCGRVRGLRSPAALI
jgi:hypothetical protein